MGVGTVRSYRFYLLLLFLVSLLVVIDQGTKLLASKAIKESTSWSVVPGFFSLTHVRNTGVAFGLGARLTSFFTVVSSVAIAFILYLLVRTDDKDMARRLGLAFLLAGAVGNLIDRVKDGYVTDFLDFEIGGFHWPAFNVADMAVCIGVGLFIWKMFNEEHGEAEPPPPSFIMENRASVEGKRE